MEIKSAILELVELSFSIHIFYHWKMKFIKLYFSKKEDGFI